MTSLIRGFEYFILCFFLLFRRGPEADAVSKIVAPTVAMLSFASAMLLSSLFFYAEWFFEAPRFEFFYSKRSGILVLGIACFSYLTIYRKGFEIFEQKLASIPKERAQRMAVIAATTSIAGFILFVSRFWI